MSQNNNTAHKQYGPVSLETSRNNAVSSKPLGKYKLVVSGTMATLFDKAGKAILRVSTKDDELTAAVLDIKQIEEVEIERLANPCCEADCPPLDLLGPVELAPGIVAQREAKK